MAKETIYPHTPPAEIPEAIGPDGKGYAATTDWRHVPQVRWLRDCDVQLGIVREDDPDGMAPGVGSLFTMVLDRGQINRLIATLRRARDAAYGKDE